MDSAQPQPKPSLKRTGWPRWARPLLAAIAAGNSLTAACEMAKIDRAWVYRVRRRDPEFQAAYEAAQDQSADSLEDECRRRAIAGSDLLLIFLLKALRPHVYRDNFTAGHPRAIVHKHDHQHNVTLDIDRTAQILEILHRAGALPIPNTMSQLPPPEASGEYPPN
jgi:hypothetical protein